MLQDQNYYIQKQNTKIGIQKINSLDKEKNGSHLKYQKIKNNSSNKLKDQNQQIFNQEQMIHRKIQTQIQNSDILNNMVVHINNKKINRNSNNLIINYQANKNSLFPKNKTNNSSNIKCLNHPFKNSKYILKQSDAFICSECAVFFANQGQQVFKINDSSSQIKHQLQVFTERLLQTQPKIKDYENQLQSNKTKLDNMYIQQKTIINQYYQKVFSYLAKQQSDQQTELEIFRQRGLDFYQKLIDNLHQSFDQINSMKDDILYDMDEICQNIQMDEFNTVMIKYNEKIDFINSLLKTIETDKIQICIVEQQNINDFQIIKINQKIQSIINQKQDQQDRNTFQNFINNYFNCINNNINNNNSNQKNLKTDIDYNQNSILQDSRKKNLHNSVVSQQSRIDENIQQRQSFNGNNIYQTINSPKINQQNIEIINSTVKNSIENMSLSNSQIESIVKSSQSANKFKGILGKVQASQSKNEQYFNELENPHINVIHEFQTSKEIQEDSHLDIIENNSYKDNQLSNLNKDNQSSNFKNNNSAQSQNTVRKINPKDSHNLPKNNSNLEFFTFIQSNFNQNLLVDNNNNDNNQEQSYQKSLFCSPTFKEF